jgi:glycosyltransferase involved in cell wall biosynthesis
MDSQMKVSVICPFYNEEAIIENTMRGMVAALEGLECEWELIVVNDGSKDASPALASEAAGGHPRVKVIGYPSNRGRGYALRYGIAEASGEILVTTEIDLSWGDDIVHQLAKAFERHPDADMIVASPNLAGGGYRNVPAMRVFLSRLGNTIIRAGQGESMTMYTGMTRAYRRASFNSLPIDQDEKEFHLEVAQKAQAFNFKIYEIPCVLEWKDHRLAKKDAPKRKSSSRVKKLIRTHMVFAAVAAPSRYILPISALMAVLSAFFLAWALINFLIGKIAVYLLITGLLIFLIAIVTFAVGMLSYQSTLIQHDLWRIRRDLLLSSPGKQDDSDVYR